MGEVVVTERSSNLVGVADSATQGTVGARQLRQRPLLRPGELLEAVPGIIITQHSGAGKANQYFLRGFNLDHGTDFATYVAGMPINMVSHGHGQGYTDLNFLIPELVSGISYRKGSYFASQGDFSSAGTAEISLVNRFSRANDLPSTTLLDAGSFDYRRAVLTNSTRLKNSDLVYGLELWHSDGPWTRPDDYRKVNGILRYTRGEETTGRFSLTGMGYSGRWNATDQIAARAINGGGLSRFDTLDPTTGGNTDRYSLSGEYVRRAGENHETRASAYGIRYKFNLFSNFTYFLDHPETDPAGQQGDQFEQADDRYVYGFSAAHRLDGKIGGRTAQNTLGIQARYDDIRNVGLYNTQARDRFNTVRQDKVRQGSIAPYAENRIRWTPTFRTTVGARWDFYSFDVSQSNIAENNGKSHDNLFSPKINFAFGPFKNTDYYINLGRGFHSNDARGTTARIDPGSGQAVSPVTPLVRSNEAEVGIRTAAVRNLQSTLSLWYLGLDSELLFVGDAGTTEPSRPSRRSGVEFTNFYTPTRELTFDADFAYSRARFRDDDPVGDYIPGSIQSVLALGASLEKPTGFLGSLRLRYFGPRPLIEDNSVRSRSTTLVYARVGYDFSRKNSNGPRAVLDVFNLLNTKSSDIDYFYTSRLRGEAAGGSDDIHLHPVESRALRLSVRWLK